MNVFFFVFNFCADDTFRPLLSWRSQRCVLKIRASCPSSSQLSRRATLRRARRRDVSGVVASWASRPRSVSRSGRRQWRWRSRFDDIQCSAQMGALHFRRMVRTDTWDRASKEVPLSLCTCQASMSSKTIKILGIAHVELKQGQKSRELIRYSSNAPNETRCKASAGSRRRQGAARFATPVKDQPVPLQTLGAIDPVCL
jgi:hypothetical protein